MSLLQSRARLKLNTPYMKSSRHSTQSFRWLLSVICFGLLAGQSCAEGPTQQPTAAERAGLVDALNTKLDGIVIPALQCNKGTLADVLETIRAAARDHDVATADAKEKGVNIFVTLPNGAHDKVMGTLITLDLKNVSLKEALEAVSEQSNLKMRVEPYAVALIASK